MSSPSEGRARFGQQASLPGHRHGESGWSAPPDRLIIDAAAAAVLSWRYDGPDGRIGALYQQAKRVQWDAFTDIDWSIQVPFGAALPVPSAQASLTMRTSPLASKGKPAWDAFQWEVQAWMACQFLHGEQAALVASGRLAQGVPDLQAKMYAASQAVDEARHMEAFSRYVREHVPDPYPIAPALRQLFEDALRAAEWDITALAVQCLAEPMALAAFRVAKTSFHDGLIKQIAARVARDEARHVSYGVLLMHDLIPTLSSAELVSREDFVLEAATLMRHRFQLAEIWERLGVPCEEGAAFTLSDPGLTAFRQVMFSRVVSMLAQIQLLTPRVRDGLTKLGLIK